MNNKIVLITIQISRICANTASKKFVVTSFVSILEKN